MYSAVHHGGRRLYELAREGTEVERAPRDVEVSAITVLAVEDARATLRVVCGKGMYVRVLAADLGSALGWGAAVERLARTRVGPFALPDAIGWEELATASASMLVTRMLPLDAARAHLPAARLDAAGTECFIHGQPAGVAPALAASAIARVYDPDGVLLGVGQATPTGDGVRPLRMVHADRPGSSVRPA
jgi:tRNA pseudouridine55 synthase